MKPSAAALLLLVAAAAAWSAVDLDAMWDFGRPAQSEARFRAALEGAQGDDALVLRTQLARALGLQRRFDDAQRELDAIEPLLPAAGPEPRVRAQLERGRVLRSSGRPADALPIFRRAFEQADAAELERLAADALHMLALAEPGLDDRIAWNRRTVDYARRAVDPKARGWEAPALNNLGSDLREAGRLEDSLVAFKEALAAYEKSGRPRQVQIARWQVANVLRLLGRTDDALAMQQALERELAAAGTTDAYVTEELVLLHAARGDTDKAEHYRRQLAKEKPP
jgi:tetratricopeptide (TPR) repeat protein